MKSIEETIEDIQQAFYDAGKGFIRQSEIKGMTVEGLFNRLSSNNIKISIAYERPFPLGGRVYTPGINGPKMDEAFNFAVFNPEVQNKCLGCFTVIPIKYALCEKCWTEGLGIKKKVTPKQKKTEDSTPIATKSSLFEKYWISGPETKK